MAAVQNCEGGGTPFGMKNYFEHRYRYWTSFPFLKGFWISNNGNKKIPPFFIHEVKWGNTESDG